MFMRQIARLLIAVLVLSVPVPAALMEEGDGELGVFEGEEATLPVLVIETPGGALPGDDDLNAALRYYEVGTDGALSLRFATPIEINLRGNTSRRFPKKSYRVKLVDERGDKRKLSLCGLRSDDDWILNPMYSDTSKIREAVSYWLWDAINSSAQAAQSSRMAFAEVILNGEYWGLYGVQERVDRKQVNADRRRGILYKITANERPTAAELMAWPGEEPCKGVELAFVGEDVEEAWLPAADYIALLDGGEAPGHARLSDANTVDYALWATLVQARDGHYKNQFIHAERTGGGYVLYRIPWDLNHTLGDLWNGEAPETNYLDYDITRLALDDVMEGLIASKDAALTASLRTRWRELRAGAITEENILDHARALFDGLYPAILRDGERWPECGMGEGNAANIRDIEDYVHTMLSRMDGWIEAL